MRQCRRCEPADSSVEKLLILVKLNNVFLGRSIVEETSPRLVSVRGVRVPAADGLKARRRMFRLQLRVVIERSHGLSLPSLRNDSVVAKKNQNKIEMQDSG
jgi:hypothetical protein